MTGRIEGMTCGEAGELLEQAVDGRLPAERGAALAAHLAACPDCAARERELEWLGRQLRRWAAARADECAPRLDLLWTRVRAGIAEARRERAAGWIRRWFWLPAAAILAAVTLLFYPSDVSRAPFHPRSFEVSVESLESGEATVALVDRGADLPRVIWIVEDGRT